MKVRRWCSPSPLASRVPVATCCRRALPTSARRLVPFSASRADNTPPQQQRTKNRKNGGGAGGTGWWRPTACVLGAIGLIGLAGTQPTTSESRDSGDEQFVVSADDRDSMPTMQTSLGEALYQAESDAPSSGTGEVKRIKRVAVIGAGASGLVCAKSLIDEGFKVTVFEQEPNIGGLWRYSDSTEGHSGCYRSLRTLSTQRMTSFKGHPIEEWMERKEKKALIDRLRSSLSPWAHHSQVLAYLEDFAEANALTSYIQFNTQVVKVSPSSTDQGKGSTTAWQITTLDRRTGEEQVNEFDAVAVCHGHHWKPVLPNVPGIESFKGRKIHSREYRDSKPFKGQRVAIIGMGDSGAAIAEEVSSVAAVTYLSTARDHLPLNPWKKHILRQTPKPRVVQMKEKSVVFSDGTETEVDTVIFCTGYRLAFPFLEQAGLSPVREKQDKEATRPWIPCGEKTALYRRVIHPNYPTLVFIGLVDVHLFSVFPVSEVQSKWVSCVLSERCSLPSIATMKAEIAQWEHSVRNVCYQPLLIDGVPYIKQIKREIKEGQLRRHQESHAETNRTISTSS